MDLIALTGEILAYGEICDHCLGRMVGKRSFGLSNDQTRACPQGESCPCHERAVPPAPGDLLDLPGSLLPGR